MKKTLLPAILSLTFSCALIAKEGMWMPQQLPEIAEDLKQAGLELDPSDLTELTEFPMGAVVSLGGCSASFVSDLGLVVTNHHCVYGSIQYNSTAEKNLIEQGFLAGSLQEELPAAPGTRVYVTVDVTDVTDRVIDEATAKMTGKARTDAIEVNEKLLVADCESDAGHRCAVYSYYGGESFYLIKRLEIRDVRLAYVPPGGVGKFGGDTDNWMWPRHTGDFGFYRAYVNRKGEPADYSEDNVPYRPEHILKLADEGVSDGDFVMLAGYPGRTNRHRLPSEIEYSFEWNYPAFVKAAGEVLAIIEHQTRDRDDAAIKYASYKAGVNNYYKNRQGMIKSYKGSDMLDRKKKLHSDLKAWVAADSSRTAQYSEAISQIETLLATRDAIARNEFHLDFAEPRLLESANRLYRLANERNKPDLDRKSGYQQRDEPRIRQRLEAIDRRYDNQVDRALSVHFLLEYLKLPAADRDASFDETLGLVDGMTEAQVTAIYERLYENSSLDDQAQRLAWMDRSVDEFRASDDSFIKLAVALYDRNLRREARDEEMKGDIQKSYALYMAALKAYLNSIGKAVYPDANSTLRITYGHVTGRTAELPDGTSWTPFTTLRGITDKHTGEGEFNAPQAQIAAIRAGEYDDYYEDSLSSVPVNFLATLDITGGNSGSAVLNSRAELVGLAFDGTLDSIISDWDLIEAKTRSIQVDLRYMLWQMKVVDKATHLLKEMGVE